MSASRQKHHEMYIDNYSTLIIINNSIILPKVVGLFEQKLPTSPHSAKRELIFVSAREDVFLDLSEANFMCGRMPMAVLFSQV